MNAAQQWTPIHKNMSSESLKWQTSLKNHKNTINWLFDRDNNLMFQNDILTSEDELMFKKLAFWCHLALSFVHVADDDDNQLFYFLSN